MRRNDPVGVFDSGFGGLSVFREFLRQLPNEEIVYFADSARCPYGTRPLEEIKRFVFEIVRFLEGRGAKMVVIACNTATAAGLEAARSRFSLPIVGIIEHGAESVVEASRNKRIGVIATEATTRSEAYKRAIRAIDPRARVFAASCQGFVELVETGRTEGGEVADVADKCLSPLRREGIDTLVLGCTHFSFMEEAIKSALGEGVVIVDPALKCVEYVKKMMRTNGLERSIGKTPVHQFFTTGDVDTFKRIGEKLLGERLSNIRHVDVQQLVLSGH